MGDRRERRGQAGSLALGGLLLGAFGSLSIVVTFLGLGPVIGLLMIWRYYPDTHGRELEDVHRDPGPDRPSGVATADRLPT